MTQLTNDVIRPDHLKQQVQSVRHPNSAMELHGHPYMSTDNRLQCSHSSDCVNNNYWWQLQIHSIR